MGRMRMAAGGNAIKEWAYRFQEIVESGEVENRMRKKLNKEDPIDCIKFK